MGNSTWELFTRSNSHHTSSDASLFSSSLPVLARETYDENHAVKSLLPDEDELLAGMVDDLVDDSEEYDIFRSGGGFELENDSLENLKIDVSSLDLSDGVVVDNGGTRLTYGVGPVTGEHPMGEHPSRTLFVRNINSNVEDEEIRTLFEQYGDIRTLYTSCKHRGFVMISYYDIRAARTAMRALQNKPLRRRKLDIHFSIPKENPSDKDINQGTLVVFNLDPSVSNDDLRQIFGVYGEVKEIRETPHKRHHKFVEFYDVRAAEAALKSLNRSDIAGKRIKLEPSRPGGARRSFLLHSNNDLEQEEKNLHNMGSLGNSPPGMDQTGNWSKLGSSMEQSVLKNYIKSPVYGLDSVLNQKVGPSKDTPSDHYLENIFANEILNSRVFFEQSRSFPEQNSSTKFESSSFNGSTASKPSSRPFWGNNGFNFSNPHHHVGSAPSGVSLEQKIGYFQELSKAPFVGPSYNDRIFSRNFVGSGSPVFDMSSGRLNHMVMGNGHFHGLGGFTLEDLAERRSRRCEIKDKKQFQIDLDRITTGEDCRTTLMIKNIPNKYTSKMLMAAIDERHNGTYDFLYLPIDFKNKCNVGYAFINMLSPSNIIPFYEEFNGKKWEKFNSEKVASLAFARIQGKSGLVAHFQNSSLMNEDKRCRPILFDSERSNDKIIQGNFRPRQSNGSDHIISPGPTVENISCDPVDER